IAMQIWTYVQMPAFAIAVAVASIAALNIGGRRWDRVRIVARNGMIYNVILTGVIAALVLILNDRLYELFLPEGSPALLIVSHINSVAVWSYVLLGIAMVLFGVIRAAGVVMIPLVVQTIALLLVRFPVAVALMEGLQADAIWWSFPISASVSVALAAW